MNMRNNSGPKIVPWETPDFTGSHVKLVPLTIPLYTLGEP